MMKNFAPPDCDRVGRGALEIERFEAAKRQPKQRSQLRQ
jgi:hypothetical protein